MKPRLSLIAPALIAALLAACATQSGGPSAPSPGGVPGVTAPPPATHPGPTLASEQQRLTDALRGTPVVVETTPEGRLRVAVPEEFSFDAGRAAVKKPLAAVLDLIASGLKQQPVFDVRIAGPTDAKGAGGSLLAQDRAASARDYLIARGVSAGRFIGLARAPDATLELAIGDKSSR